MEMSCGIPSAGCPVFVQFNGDSEFVKAMEMDGSCFSLGLVFRMCLITLLKVVYAEMRVGVQFASFLHT